MNTVVPARFLPFASIVITAGVAVTGCSADSPTESAGSGGGSHSVDHARGETEVPDDPQRVVALEPVELDTAVALGVTPVGATVAGNISGIPDYLGVENIAPVGTVPEPNLEAIAEVDPDLILGTDSRHAEYYDQLSDIAPTVFMRTQADPWQDNVELIGEALGKSEEARGLLDGYNERCEQIKADFGQDGKTANMIRPRDEVTLSIYGPTSFAGSALECVGLSIPEQDWADGVQADISPENFTAAKADYVFVTTNDVDDKRTIPEVIASNEDAFPVVTPVDTSYWVSGVGPTGGQKVLDDLERFLKTRQ